MLSLPVVFWMQLLLFGLIGSLRGWAREMLVLCGLILALFLNSVIVQFVPGAAELLSSQTPVAQFSVRAMFLCGLAFFGYQTPTLSAAIAEKTRREKLEDMLLGFFLGLLNGYLLAGALWYYLDATGYPINGVLPPIEDVSKWLQYMPPVLLAAPYIYFAVGLVFLFVIVMFV